MSDADKTPSVIPLTEANNLVKGRHGWFLANRLDLYLGGALIRYGEYSEIEQSFLASLVQPGHYVVEVGANIGAHTVGLARRVSPGGMIIAIEPQPQIFRVLCANLALNGLTNVTPFALGAGERHERMFVPHFDYANSVHNSGSASLQRDGAGAMVQVVPLDEMLEDVPSVRLIKIDVEGMEREVLAGATRLIAEHRPLLYVENDRVSQSDALITAIAALDYRMYWHICRMFNPANYFGVVENVYGDTGSFNMICEPTESPNLGNGLPAVRLGFHPLVP